MTFHCSESSHGPPVPLEEKMQTPPQCGLKAVHDLAPANSLNSSLNTVLLTFFVPTILSAFCPLKKLSSLPPQGLCTCCFVFGFGFWRFFFFFLTFLYLFCYAKSFFRLVGSSSLSRDQTWASCIGNAES